MPKNKHDGQYMTKFLVEIPYIWGHYKFGLLDFGNRSLEHRSAP